MLVNKGAGQSCESLDVLFAMLGKELSDFLFPDSAMHQFQPRFQRMSANTGGHESVSFAILAGK